MPSFRVCCCCLLPQVAGILESYPSVSALSFVALSLGGLYARYAAVVLEEQGRLTRLRLRNFITLASPHVGVVGHLNAVFDAAVRLGVCGTTGYELTLRDDTHRQQALLLEMTTPRFLAPLARFENRVLYANRYNDDKVPYQSAALLRQLPPLMGEWTDPGVSGTLFRARPVAATDAEYPYVVSRFAQFGAPATSDGVGDDVSDGTCAAACVEAVMLSRLRSVGNWTNVDVEFEDDWAAPFINHHRIVAKAPFGSMGEPVVQHVVKESFVL